MTKYAQANDAIVAPNLLPIFLKTFQTMFIIIFIIFVISLFYNVR